MNSHKRSIQSTSHAQALARLRAELDALMGAGAEPAIPAEPGGWWHNYVCPEHHTELRYDPLERDAHRFACPHGCQLQGEPYRGAWLVFKHQAMARYALQGAAVFAATRSPKYARFSYGILLRYAEQFPRYPVHPDAEPWMLKGRAFHQALTEAIWATTMLRAWLLLGDEQAPLPEAWAEKPEVWPTFLRMLAESLEQAHGILTRERGQPESNYTAWLNAALCSVYAAVGDEQQLMRVLVGEGGFREHLSLAIRPDQLEYEGSIYYHLFVLRAYMITEEMAARYGHDLYAERGNSGQSLEGMLDVTAALADAKGQLPAIHDGPYSREPYAREIAEIFEQGYARYGKPEYANIAACAYGQMYGSRKRDGLEAVLYGTRPWPESESEQPGQPDSAAYAGSDQKRSETAAPLLLPQSGFAVLRHSGNPLYAIIDFGPHGGSHGHFDKLNLMLYHHDYPLSPDRGMVPYGSLLRKQWYPQTACHNTVSIGRRSQREAEGESLRLVAAEDYSYSWTRTSQAYEGAVLDRHLWVTSEWLLDWFEVTVDAGNSGGRKEPERQGEPEQQLFDWWFHFLGEASRTVFHRQGLADKEVSCETKWQTLGDSENSDGYRFVQGRCLSDPAVFGQRGAGEHKGDSGQWSFLIRQTDLAGGALSPESASEDNRSDRCSEPVAVSLWHAANMELWAVRSPGVATDPTVPMEGVLLRQKGKSARFIAVYSAGDTPVRLEWEDKDTLKISEKSEQRKQCLTLTSDGLQVLPGNEQRGRKD